jgi:hypothetical protein
MKRKTRRKRTKKPVILMSKIQDNNVQNIVSLRRRLMNSKHGNNETIEVIIDSFIAAEGNIN